MASKRELLAGAVANRVAGEAGALQDTVGERLDQLVPQGDGAQQARAAPLGGMRLRHTRSPIDLAARLDDLSGRLIEAGRRALAEERAFGHFFHFVPVFLGAGAVAWFVLERPPPTVVLLPFLLLVTVWAIASRHRHQALHHLLAAAALFTAGMIFAAFETERQRTVILDTAVTTTLTGEIEGRERGPSGEWRYIVRLSETVDPVLKRPPSRVSLIARSRHSVFPIGTLVTGTARLSPPSGPALAGLNDFAFASFFNGIGAVGFFYGAPRVAGVADPSAADGSSALTAAARQLQSVRTAITDRIHAVVPGDPGAFAAAIVTGERRAMSKDVVEALRLSGLAHVISISGLHMALAAGLFFVGLRMLLSLSAGLAQAYPIKKIAAGAALVAAFCYLLISGAQVSAERAFIMMAVMLGAVILDRPAISMRNLALSAIVIVAVSPSQVMGPSFQMSFAATAALIAGYAGVRRAPARDRPWPLARDVPVLSQVMKLFAGIFLTSLIGGLSTAMFSVEHFHRLGAYSLAGNLAAMPIVSFIVMPAGLIAMILMPFGLDAYPLMVMGFGLELVIGLARAVAGWGGEVGFERLPAWFLPVASIGFLLLTLLRTWLRHPGTAILAAVLAGAAFATGAQPGEVLIAETGQLVAIVGQQTLATNRTRPPQFIFSQWQAALQRPEHVKPEIGTSPALAPYLAREDRTERLSPEGMATAGRMMREMSETALQNRFACLDKAWCLARLANGWRIATVEEDAFVGLACDLADVVVTPRRLQMRQCRSGALLITADTLRLTGALELTSPDNAAGNPQIHAAFSATDRPWQIHRRYDWRSDTFRAQSDEDLPPFINGSGE